MKLKINMNKHSGTMSVKFIVVCPIFQELCPLKMSKKHFFTYYSVTKCSNFMKLKINIKYHSVMMSIKLWSWSTQYCKSYCHWNSKKYTFLVRYSVASGYNFMNPSNKHTAVMLVIYLSWSTQYKKMSGTKTLPLKVASTLIFLPWISVYLSQFQFIPFHFQ